MYLNQQLNQNFTGLFSSTNSGLNSLLKSIDSFLKDLRIQNKLFKQDVEVNGPIRQILSAVRTCTKQNCISSASFVSKFLDHPDSTVRETASRALQHINMLIMNYLSREENPNNSSELTKGAKELVSSITSLINKGSINSDISLSIINDSITQLNGVIKGAFLNSDPETLKSLINSESNSIRGMTCSGSGFSDCIKGIQDLVKYLSSDNPFIKKIASDSLCKLIKQATLYLKKEDNPVKIKSYSKLLLEVSSSIKEKNQSGEISLDSGVLNALNDAISTSKEKLNKTIEQDQDIFIKFDNKKTCIKTKTE